MKLGITNSYICVFLITDSKRLGWEQQ